MLLRFDSVAYERRFVDHYVDFYLRYAQASLVLGVLLVLGDFGVDWLAHPEVKANFLRLELCLPLLMVGLAYSFVPAARRHWQAAMAGFIAGLGFLLFWILLRIDGEGGAGLKTWVGVLNFTFLQFYCFVILGVQFRYALVSGASLLCAFEAAMWRHAGMSGAEVAYWSYHVVTLFMLAAGIGWWREYLLRKEFTALTSLEEARAAAERLATIKGDFLATMSHEIRTPLNGVLGMNELLIDSELQPQQRAWAEAVQSSGQHLLGVINDILDFSKADSGRMQLDAVDFDLVDVVEEAVLMFAQPAESKGLELAVQYPPAAEHLAVRGDAFRLRQIVANLVSNAIKFTSEGEVITRVSLLAQSEGEVSIGLCVEDTGVGIAPQAQARIFEQFAQADGSTTRQYGGTGLGLAICKRLLELMGGSIHVDSAPGRGSKFRFELRLPKAVSAARTAASLAGVRVLVVDDNRSVRDILQQQFQGWAMAVSCAADAATALQQLEQAAQAGQAFDLAVLDMHMPRIGGLQLARAIQALPARPAPRLVMLGSTSAHADPKIRQALGPLGCINKPLRRAELRRLLAGTLAAEGPLGLAAPPPASDRATRLRGQVLLVEDNPINQRLATTMLEKLGLSVSLAVDGSEAVEQVCRQNFDLVLMDCQMPVMDGLEATRRIRAWEASREPGRAALPIIALTATALPSDREACAAAGMSDFLGKPFSGDTLGRMLARHLGPRASEAAEPMARSTPSRRALVFDASVLAELPMVADGSDPGFASSVLEQFIQASGEAIDGCRRAEAAADGDALLRGVHTLKSISAQVGASSLALCAGGLENQLRAGRALQAGDWARLEAEHGQLMQAISAHLAQSEDLPA